MSSPEFSLAACPRCSSRAGGLCAPFWKFAHRTSAVRMRACYFWVGFCKHAEVGIADASKIYDEPSEWERVEAAWSAKAQAMFAEQTAGWGVVQRERWAALLASRTYIEGTTASLDLSPESSGTTKPTN